MSRSTDPNFGVSSKLRRLHAKSGEQKAPGQRPRAGKEPSQWKSDTQKSAVKALESLDRPTKARIRAGIHGLTQKPPLGDIKAMQGYHDGRFRLRVGKYRIVYRYGVESQLEILYIMDIGSRRDIYKK